MFPIKDSDGNNITNKFYYRIKFTDGSEIGTNMTPNYRLRYQITSGASSTGIIVQYREDHEIKEEVEKIWESERGGYLLGYVSYPGISSTTERLFFSVRETALEKSLSCVQKDVTPKKFIATMIENRVYIWLENKGKKIRFQENRLQR